jgi:hypothetical protein
MLENHIGRGRLSILSRKEGGGIGKVHVTQMWIVLHSMVLLLMLRSRLAITVSY